MRAVMRGSYQCREKAHCTLYIEQIKCYHITSMFIDNVIHEIMRLKVNNAFQKFQNNNFKELCWYWYCLFWYRTRQTESESLILVFMVCLICWCYTMIFCYISFFTESESINIYISKLYQRIRVIHKYCFDTNYL